MSQETTDPDALREFACAVYESAGVPPEDARLVADTLVQADLWGHQSHGVLRLGWYLERIRSGAMRAVTNAKVVRDHGAIAVIDGDDGIGQVLAAQAADEAIRRAKAYGIGAVGVRNSNHFGTAMYYTLAAPRAGCIAFLSTNASPAMAPWGGRRKGVGTNPWSIAAPAAGRAPIVMDIANTAVARGKVYLARQKGIDIPPGWASDADGEPTIDAQKAIEGLILPMAGHKGYAIALMMDVLSGVLTGSGFGDEVHGPYEAKARSRCGHLMIALDIDAFQPRAEFDERMERLIALLKNAPRANGVDEIFYPGELEARSDATLRTNGLVLPPDTLRDLERIAQQCGLERRLPR